MNSMDALESFLLNNIAADLGKKSISPDEDLLMQGIIDSLGILKLATFIEETFGIQVTDEDMVPENFQNLNSLKEFIEQKRQK
ncbi:MAG: acyl carrier protein [Candidatus Marinimicrobia bacterium]|nr:acyl carrier protein [Candidatus Neomarinimicrobiota bacterium]